MRDYYNEVDPYAAQHLRNLIAAGEIPAGDVDERDIRDVRPADLDGYRRCHFFAGVGVWARALQEAGWPDDLPVWTGSCPCQPFSAAGKGAGFDDERHLWPDWHWLIEQCRPEIVLGEQVASADGLVWADLVSADLEATGYALGPVDTCAAGFRSFHIRQRLYFAAHDLVSAADVRAARAATIRRFGGMVDALYPRLEGHRGHGFDRHQPGRIGAQPHGPVAATGAVDRLADSERLERIGRRSGQAVHEPGSVEGTERRGDAVRLDHAPSPRHQPERQGAEGQARDKTRLRGSERRCGALGVADSDGRDTSAERQQPGGQQRLQPEGGGCGERLEDPDRQRRHGQPVRLQQGEPRQAGPQTAGGGSGRRLADTECRAPERHGHAMAGTSRGMQSPAREQRVRDDAWNGCPDLRADPSDGYWRDADWLFCRDGVWRPVEPGTFPLASKTPARLGRLRAYGNALDLAQATGFCRAYLERDVGGGHAGDLFEWGA